jgi:hypothetical protein
MYVLNRKGLFQGQILASSVSSRYNFDDCKDLRASRGEVAGSSGVLIENAGVSAYITAESFLVLSPAPPLLCASTRALTSRYWTKLTNERMSGL